MKNEKDMTVEAFKELLEDITSENVTEEVKDMLEVMEQYHVRWKKDIPWKGYEVYSPVFTGKAPIIGLPYVVLVKEGKARLSTGEESLEYLNIKDE